MRRLLTTTLALVPSFVFADRIGPPELYKPIPKILAAEQPCDAATPRGDKLVGKYMCQIGLQGKFLEPYPCEIIASSATASYLRFARYDVYCNVVATVHAKSLALSGSLDCRNSEPNVIGDYAVFDGKAKPIGGGYRVELQIEHFVDRTVGSTMAKEQLTLNVCRRPWPKGTLVPSEGVRR